MASHGMESQVGSVLGAPAIAVAVPAAGADWLREGATYPEPCCWVAPPLQGVAGDGRARSGCRVDLWPLQSALEVKVTGQAGSRGLRCPY